MYYLNQVPAQTPPLRTGPGVPPRWFKVSAGHSYGWHDGRLHALATAALASRRQIPRSLDRTAARRRRRRRRSPAGSTTRPAPRSSGSGRSWWRWRACWRRGACAGPSSTTRVARGLAATALAGFAVAVTGQQLHGRPVGLGGAGDHAGGRAGLCRVGRVAPGPPAPRVVHLLHHRRGRDLGGGLAHRGAARRLRAARPAAGAGAGGRRGLPERRRGAAAGGVRAGRAPAPPCRDRGGQRAGRPRAGRLRSVGDGRRPRSRPSRPPSSPRRVPSAAARPFTRPRGRGWARVPGPAGRRWAGATACTSSSLPPTASCSSPPGSASAAR